MIEASYFAEVRASSSIHDVHGTVGTRVLPSAWGAECKIWVSVAIHITDNSESFTESGGWWISVRHQAAHRPPLPSDPLRGRVGRHGEQGKGKKRHGATGANLVPPN